MRCVRASNVPHTSEQKVHSTFNCGSSQATTRVLVVKTGIEVLRQKSKSIHGQTERTRRHLRNDYRLTDGQKTSRNIDPMRLRQICFGYSRLACSPSMLHIQDRQSNQRTAKRLSEPCNIYRRAGYNGVFEPHLGNIVCRDSLYRGGGQVVLLVVRSGSAFYTFFSMRFHRTFILQNESIKDSGRRVDTMKGSS